MGTIVMNATRVLGRFHIHRSGSLGPAVAPSGTKSGKHVFVAVATPHYRLFSRRIQAPSSCALVTHAPLQPFIRHDDGQHRARAPSLSPPPSLNHTLLWKCTIRHFPSFRLLSQQRVSWATFVFSPTCVTRLYAR
jgi:hypothetical protein